ncbi:hypothetical protein BpOF4_15645 [Alkalihalophilus pseudofirmus OF4]|uniref:DUF5590 domain-containing protein n=2 Tax=Alkalihalophilus pseudofirmus TaxID=79885 RepID=D3G0L6_ALKPO|nr:MULTISPECIES: DUF5590 domain-containing protein [Alkalihalophilus]ADC51178.1 hypothetical protein BpOF4_15645 [Alkalihalophilus pseudofirmus OF4]MDV2884369.1 DUF5590 domain-containing protein [Alkalihalophilus pseudofirmus]MED1601547.1 DUF5590 domain-containing protein [Alkalihalophilus marmarensis]WEG18386.1 DUF5590 domain-containing protein [Alkalihalophilus pseudofirmus]
MKKIIFTGLVVGFLALVGTSAYAYHIIRAPLVESYNEAKDLALSNQHLQTVEGAHYYHGTEAYYVLTGTNDDNDEMIVFVGDDLETVHELKRADGISYDQAMEIAQRELPDRKIEKIRLGYTRGVPVYEVMYNDQNARTGYYYLTFEDGSFLKRYSIRNINR